MDASFQEKSLRVTFVTVLVAFALYFGLARPGAATDIQPRQVALFVGAVVLLVVTQVVGQVFVALRDRRPDTDERDRLISLKGTRNGAFVLACGVFSALCAGLVTRGNSVFMHVLLGAWVLAQLVETGTQLWLYRRGV